MSTPETSTPVPVAVKQTRTEVPIDGGKFPRDFLPSKGELDAHAERYQRGEEQDPHPMAGFITRCVARVAEHVEKEGTGMSGELFALYVFGDKRLQDIGHILVALGYLKLLRGIGLVPLDYVTQGSQAKGSGPVRSVPADVAVTEKVRWTISHFMKKGVREPHVQTVFFELQRTDPALFGKKTIVDVERAIHWLSEYEAKKSGLIYKLNDTQRAAKIAEIAGEKKPAPASDPDRKVISDPAAKLAENQKRMAEIEAQLGKG